MKTVDFPVKTKAIDKDAGIFEVMISTEDVDRSGDIVRASGAQLQNYRKNPVVMYGHDYSIPPIGKALSVDVLPGVGIKSRFQFPPKGIHPLADTIRGLWSEGFINAASIGFNPIKSVSMDPARPFGPQEYTEWELLEYSLIPVPANQSALRMAYQKTLRLNPVSKDQVDQALDLGLEIVKEARHSSNTQYLMVISKYIDLIGAVLSRH